MTKLLFPPFIDRHVAQNVTEADWEQALNLWKSNLSILLKLPDHEFAKHLIENESLRTFIETFLKIRADFQELLILERTAKSTEMPLDKKVLLVLLRCSQPKLDIINLIQGKSLMDALYKLKFLSVPLLLDFLVNYGKSNFDHAREFFDNLILLVPSVIQDFESFSGIIIDHIKSLKQKIEEAKANNEVDLQNHALESYKKYILQMIDVAITLDCLFSISKVVASIYSNLPGSGEDQSLLKVVKSFYEFTLPSISNTMSPENTKEFARILNILKHALVSLIYHMIEASYFSPVGFTVEVGDNSIFKESDKKLTNHAQIQATLDRMNDVLFWIIEQSILEKPVLSFVDAPLILDLEIEFNLSAKLTRIKDETEDARIDYVNKSLEMMRNMVQETPPRRKRAEQMKNKILMVNGRVKHQKPSPLERAVEENAKRLSLISQVRNVFPELGEGFVEACLISLNENPETVINHLLENTLPGDLEILDRSLPRLPTQFNRGVENMETDLVEESPLANRHNIFDDDEEFNVFSGRTVDLSRLHQGKKNRGTAERLLDDKSFVDSYRESIIENAYNMYEDEYDDTYDTSGLKTGAVDIHLLDELEESQDSQRHGDQIDPGIIHESELIKTYTTDPSVFERTNQVRKSKKREELRRITQMTDEQLEGWFIMFQRNPRKDRLLEKYEWRGQQEFLDNDEDQSSSQSERYAATSNQGRGRGNTRGKAPHRGGEGGNTASRAQKERHKGRGANHNRKNAHSRKMGKGFGSLPLDS